MTPGSRYEQIAAIHIAALNQGFLSSLGLRFLSLMYQCIDECPKAVLITSEDQGKVLGFVSGSKGMGPIYRQILKKPVRLAFTLFPALLKPSSVRRILNLVRYSRGKSTDPNLPSYELLSIAVAPDARNRGTGAELFDQLVKCLDADGIVSFKILVGDTLEDAHRFYQKRGAEQSGKLSLHGTDTSTIYVFNIAGVSG